MNIQDRFLLGCTGWISLQSEGLSRVFSNTTVQKHQFFSTQLSLYSPALTSIHDHFPYNFEISHQVFVYIKRKKILCNYVNLEPNFILHLN